MTARATSPFAAMDSGLALSARPGMTLALLRFLHVLRDKPRQGKRRNVHLRRPVPGPERARLLVARRDHAHGMLAQLLVLGGPAHRHVAAHVSGDRRNVTRAIGEQALEHADR